MKQLIFLFFILSFSHNAKAGDGDYAIFKIDRALLKEANAVMRLEEDHFEIVNTGETVFKKHYAVTILNEKGDDWAELSENYDKHRYISFIEGYLYDALGRQLKKIKTKDTQDISGVSDGSLMDDHRYKRHNFYYRSYPYTIEYYIEIVDKSTLFFPPWVPQNREGIAVEQSSYSMEYPAGYQVRYKAFNYKQEPEAGDNKKNKMLTWKASNLPAIYKEIFSPRWNELATIVIFGPGDFQVDNYKGNMVSWQDFGKFVYSLKAGRDQLPDAVKQTIHTIADGITDPKEKIARLYEYMQKNTRYISIQLGIGGWQPFDAKEVAVKGYGDCKALTNFMYSILKEAGLPSFYALVYAGRNNKYINSDFPSQQFDHVILCVPLHSDTMWLECTSHTLQAGYLGEFTCDRPALLIDENGGKLIHTPVYGMNDNLEIRKIKAVLTEDGTLNIQAETRYGGLQQDDLHEMINELAHDKLKEELHALFDLGTYNIDKFSYVQEKTFPPCIDESLKIAVSNYATVTGKRLFIIPNIMSRSGIKLTHDTARKYDIQLEYEYKDVDSVEIEIPAGYVPEALPEPIKLGSKFGNYCCSVKLSGNKIYYYRSMEHFSGRYPAQLYSDLVKFYQAIYRADRNKIVLVKN